MPHASDPEYAERAIPQYECAVTLAGGTPVRISLDASDDDIRRTAESCAAVLLPGSKADIDPARFKAARSPHTAAADPRRDQVDHVLLAAAYRLRKPVLGICYGLQSLNVYCGGSLVQHIPDFLPEELRAKVDHEAGSKVPVAHTVEVDPSSLLAEVLRVETDGNSPSGNSPKISGVCGDSRPRLSSRAELGNRAPVESTLVLQVNSSHHQSVDAIGRGLRVVARCTEDHIVEALEGNSRDHFVVAVQWHPERSVADDEASRRIFRALVHAAEQ
jgi:putative glutamine amidotransferase